MLEREKRRKFVDILDRSARLAFHPILQHDHLSGRSAANVSSIRRYLSSNVHEQWFPIAKCSLSDRDAKSSRS